MVAQIVCATGWTWDETLDTVTMPRYAAIQAEWQVAPPTHYSVAAYLGTYKPRQMEPEAQAGDFLDGFGR
jgi:hypothetical protein